MMTNFRNRLANFDDIPAIAALMELAITENMKAFLSPEEIQIARQSMGVDRLLIEDQTYFLIEAPAGASTDLWVLVGCGGWGRRKTLFGGDHTAGRDDSFSDPAVDPARVRAMYTHPQWVRQGIGTLLLELAESAARDAGFKTIELGATLSGEPLYQARGYLEVARSDAKVRAASSSGRTTDARSDKADDQPADPVIKMAKNL